MEILHTLAQIWAWLILLAFVCANILVWYFFLCLNVLEKKNKEKHQALVDAISVVFLKKRTLKSYAIFALTISSVAALIYFGHVYLVAAVIAAEFVGKTNISLLKRKVLGAKP